MFAGTLTRSKVLDKLSRLYYTVAERMMYQNGVNTGIPSQLSNVEALKEIVDMLTINGKDFHFADHDVLSLTLHLLSAELCVSLTAQNEKLDENKLDAIITQSKRLLDDWMECLSANASFDDTPLNRVREVLAKFRLLHFQLTTRITDNEDANNGLMKRLPTVEHMDNLLTLVTKITSMSKELAPEQWHLYEFVCILNLILEIGLLKIQIRHAYVYRWGGDSFFNKSPNFSEQTNAALDELLEESFALIENHFRPFLLHFENDASFDKQRKWLCDAVMGINNPDVEPQPSTHVERSKSVLKETMLDWINRYEKEMLRHATKKAAERNLLERSTCGFAFVASL
jgi:hypothetical protein